MKRLAVLISNKGKGTNLRAIINSIRRGVIKNATITVVISDKSDAEGLKIALQNNIQVYIADYHQYKMENKSREMYDNDLGKLLSVKYNIDLVILAGWMRILSQKFINFFPNKIINLHPGLLPDTNKKYIPLKNGRRLHPIRGLHTDAAVQYALDHNFPITGSTVHFITDKVDEGPVIIRGEVDIVPGDTVETLYKRMKKKEHQILPHAVKLFCEDRLKFKSGKVIINS